jgi:hypothetical protein
MSTYLINHLRIPGDVPKEEGLAYLEQVGDTTVDLILVDGVGPDFTTAGYAQQIRSAIAAAAANADTE